MDDLASQIQSLFILFGLLLVPALLILTIFLYMRKRRSSFPRKHRRRNGQSKSDPSGYVGK